MTYTYNIYQVWSRESRYLVMLSGCILLSSTSFVVDRRAVQTSTHIRSRSGTTAPRAHTPDYVLSLFHVCECVYDYHAVSLFAAAEGSFFIFCRVSTCVSRGCFPSAAAALERTYVRPKRIILHICSRPSSLFGR